MRVLKLIEFRELKILNFRASRFDHNAVSDFLLILDDGVTQQFAQHVSYY